MTGALVAPGRAQEKTLCQILELSSVLDAGRSNLELGSGSEITTDQLISAGLELGALVCPFVRK